MNIHEYQAKNLLRGYGVPVLNGRLATTAAEAAAGAEDIGGLSWVVKAQIHAGGRGKAGGVKIARGPDEVAALAGQMLGAVLITAQTGPKGRLVSKVYIEETCRIAREMYLSVMVDRNTARVTFIVSAEGGMDIETLPKDRICTFPIDPAIGFCPYIGRKIAATLGLKGKAAQDGAQLAQNLYTAFTACDMSLLEINPLVLTDDNELLLLDAKIAFDDNALFRHSDILALRDPSEEDPAEIEADEAGLSYIRLDGSIGCMVNGAGLAMATMDIIKLYGGEPANFLDVGGGATREQVTRALRIILADAHVKGVLVNIFGGIMKCDVIAEGIIAAAREVHLSLPVVVRLAGTNVDKGKEILARSGLNLTAAEDLADAAKKIVAAVTHPGRV